MTYNVKELNKIITRGAKSALNSWKQSHDGLDDLVQELWLWYTETPSTQEKIAKIEPHEAVKTVKIRALQLLSKQTLSSNTFRGMNLYSSESVKYALEGLSSNKYLKSIMPVAMASLEKQNPGHAEAIRARYEFGEVPADNAPKQVLKRAVKSLTEHVNVIAITAGLTTSPDGTVAPASSSPGVGRRNEMFPEHRRQRGGPPSDPTGDMAIMLIEHPELRDEYLHEEPITEYLWGPR